MVSKSIAGWGVAALGLLGYGLFLAMNDAPPVRAYAHVDFYDYYFAADAVRGGADPYDATACDARAAAARVPVIPRSDYIYPAWFAAALVPLTSLPPRAAAALWFAVSAGLLLVTLARLLPFEQRGWAAAGILFPPALFSLFVGQVNVVLLALVAVAWRRRDDRPALAGLALGLAAAIKLSPVLLLALALWRGRRRLATAAATTLLGCLIVGELASPGSTWTYATQVLPSISTLSARHAHPVNQSLAAFFLRHLTPNQWTDPWWRAPQLAAPLSWLAIAALAAAIPLVTRNRPSGKQREAAEWGATICLMVIASPLAWESTFTLLLLPFALALGGGGPRWGIAGSWGLIAAQRGLDDFANHPEVHPFLASVPAASSLALLGALVLYASVLRVRRGG